MTTFKVEQKYIDRANKIRSLAILNKWNTTCPISQCLKDLFGEDVYTTYGMIFTSSKRYIPSPKTTEFMKWWDIDPNSVSPETLSMETMN